MLKIILVDDEPIVRLTIQSLGPWQTYGFQFAFEAANGQEALEQLKSDPSIDIILTDISMPKMNGIEFIKQAKTINPNIAIIVLSAYNDYPYVREAFKLGIQDYILKSDLSFQSLLKLFEKVKENIDTVNRHLKEINDNTILLKQKVIEDLLTGVQINTSREKLDSLHIKIKNTNNVVCLFEVDDYKLQEDRYDSEILAKIDNSIANIFSQKIIEYNTGEVLCLSKGRYVLIASFEGEHSASVMFQKLNQLINDIKYSLSELLNISVTVGVSAFSDGLENIPSLYQQAVQAVKFRLIWGKGKTINQQDIINITNTAQINISSFKKEIIAAIESLDTTGAQSILSNLKQYIVELNPSKINVVYSLYIEIIYYILNYLIGKDLQPDDILDQELDFYHKINEYETIDEINRFLEGILLKIIEELKQKNENIPLKLKKAREYIRAHYHENISLKSVAEYLYVSEAYISRLFTKEMGESFINYVTHLRIEKAKELLKNSDLSINEISERVGYYNQEHFSRVFKKHEGCSPNKYR
jgi:YesN/AraC family two-component response regulator